MRITSSPGVGQQRDMALRRCRAVAVRDDDLAEGVVERTASAGDEVCYGLLHLVEP